MPILVEILRVRLMVGGAGEITGVVPAAAEADGLLDGTIEGLDDGARDGEAEGEEAEDDGVAAGEAVGLAVVAGRELAGGVVVGDAQAAVSRDINNTIDRITVCFLNFQFSISDLHNLVI
jgi:hypothetical protein